ncbi:glycosyltransferase [Marinicrinis lubricantis]|uniref:Glycosyltransferase n=1 Tax=Marinicrinis lubricantis TaxID=2086470 RepID=A0ABW1IJW1_9BACL
MRRDIVFFPWRDYNQIQREGYRTREANVLKELMHRNDIGTILCVNRPNQPKILNWVLSRTKKYKYYISDKKKDAGVQQYSRWFSTLKRMNDRLYVLELDYHIPNPKGNLLEQSRMIFNTLENEVKHAIRFLKMQNYLLWSFDLSRSKIFGGLAESSGVKVFDAIDNLLDHDQFKHKKMIKNHYDEVHRNADIVFTVSESIKNELFNGRNKVEWIPNGIDLRRFTQAEYQEIEDLPKGKPIIGYVGLMQERIDLDVLLYTVKTLRDFNFVFVGPLLSEDYFKEIKLENNTYFLGTKHHDDIPNYISKFDTCIIPHKVNKFTKSMNPLKIYEYLAAGKEVVTTPVPPSEQFQNILHIAYNKEQFCQLVKETIVNPFSKFSREQIEQHITAHGWNHRVEYMLKYIESHTG